MNIKMRTDINKNALLVSLIVACERALDDNPIFAFVEGEGYYISDTLVEIRERELTKAQMEVFYGKEVSDTILSIGDTEEMQNFINYGMTEIEEFYKNQSKEDIEKANKIANKFYKKEWYNGMGKFQSERGRAWEVEERCILSPNEHQRVFALADR